MTTETNRYRLLLHGVAGLLTILFVAAALGLLIEPLEKREKQALARIAEANRLVSNQGVHRKTQATLARELGALKQEDELLLRRIPDAPNESAFLAFITEAADHAELTIKDYRPGAVRHGERFSQMELRLSAKGSFQAICQFTKDMETAERLSTIEMLAITETKDAKCLLELSVMLFFGGRLAATNTNVTTNAS